MGLRVLAWQSQAEVTVQEGRGWRNAHDDDAHHWVVCADDHAAVDQVVAAIRMTLHPDIDALPDADVYRDVLPSNFPVPVASYNRMVVDPAHRRRGLSTVLDAVCIEHARLVGAAIIVVSTAALTLSDTRQLGRNRHP